MKRLLDQKFSLAFGPLVLVAIVAMGLQSLFSSPALETKLTPLALSNHPQSSDEAVANIVDRVTPAVVTIQFTRGIGASSARRLVPLDPFDLTPLPQRGLASGVIATADGLILTNHHVIRHANDIRVLLSDRREFKAKVVGSDAPTDVAVLQIDAKGLPTVPFGDSSKVRVGHSVLAIGNSLGVGQTVSMGIVSARGRANVGIADYEDFLQTDAAINPGNSGGPLVNMKGEVVGINTAIATRSGGFQGIGFAIPINMAREVMDSIVKNGKVNRGQLGVLGQDMTPALARAIDGAPAEGVLVSEVLEKSGAKEAGLKREDILLKLDGRPVASVSDLRNRVALRGAGAEVTLHLWRDKKTMDLKVRLHETTDLESKDDAEDDSAQEENHGASTGLEGIYGTPATPALARRLGLPKGATGVVVTSVAVAAAFTGVKTGDLVVEVDRHPVANVAEMEKAVKNANHDSVLLTVERREGVLFISVPKR